MKTIQASFREWDLPYPRLPHSREQSWRRKTSRTTLTPGILMSLVTMSSTQHVVYRKGQPTATLILIYDYTRREVVQQCIANLMSTFHVYPHSEVITSSLTDRFEDLLLCWFYKPIKPIAIPANTGEHGVVKNSLNFSVFCIRNCQMRLTRTISR